MLRWWRGKSRTVITRRAWTATFLLTTSILAGCTQQSTVQSPDPQAVLQAIPAADSTQYDRIRDMKKWRNPYLIVRSDGVALLDTADSAEIILRPEEVLPALAKLPHSSWPYGRVVAAAESAAKNSEQDGVALRKNKGIMGGILEGAHIAVKWVPAG